MPTSAAPRSSWSPTTPARRAVWRTRSSSCATAGWRTTLRPRASSTSRGPPARAPSSRAESSSKTQGVSAMTRHPMLLAAAALAVLTLPDTSSAADDHIVIQSTTSTEASGLFDHILPIFEDTTGIDARVVAVGTGQALKNAQNCDGDVLFVHAKPDELEFVAHGYGVDRQDVMYNDFVIVGPSSDPAGVGGGKDAAAALQKIAASKAPFA